MKQSQGLDRFAKIKFSEIDFNETTPVQQRRLAMQFLLKNGYAAMDSYAMAEIIRFIRSLQELKLEYVLKTIDRNVNNTNDAGMIYEFTLGYFEDDRLDKLFVGTDGSWTLTGAVTISGGISGEKVRTANEAIDAVSAKPLANKHE